MEDRDQQAATFCTAAASAGYDERQIGQLLTAARRLPLAMDVATGWLEGGLTPWAAVTWLQRGFGSPAEAALNRNGGLDAEAAYWLKFDRRHEGTDGSPASGMDERQRP
jgi:hypothetical protein